MERARRGPDLIDVQVCSVQDGEARFSRSDEDGSRGPPVAGLRNNLAGLSQKHNLLFVAYQSVIYTFRPEFPNQTLPKKAILAIDLPRTSNNLRGFIDPRNPHAVNHLMVGDIGHEEILLTSSDDGDVIAFTTNSIQQAIQDNVAGNTDIGCRLNAFFIENVGHSAWGLAIHKAARLIAVSANTHEITVFAFALGNNPESENGSEDEGYALSSSIDTLGGGADWLYIESSIDPPERSKRNIKVRLIGHETNIPSITFCNNDADLHGKYLVSTDIDGQTFVWDVWRRKIIGSLSKSNLFGDRVSSAGWGVACLDPKALRRSDFEAARFSCDTGRTNGLAIQEISHTVLDVPDSSHFHAATVDPTAIPGQARDAWHEFISRQYRTALNTQSLESNTIGAVYHAIFSNLQNQRDVNLDEHDEEHPELWELQNGFDEAAAEDTVSTDSDESHGDEWEEPLETLQEGALQHRRPSVASSAVDTAPTQRLESQNNLSQDATDNRLHGAQKLPFQQSETPSSHLGSNSSRFSTDQGLHLYSLCTDTHGINLFTVNTFPPTSCVVCNNVLRQVRPYRLSYLDNFERLNMIEQIPELGVVIIASQTGRVAIFTTIEVKSPPGTAMRIGLRIERILPFKSQEEADERPDFPLMGIAVGPVQGYGIEVAAAGDESPVQKETDAPKLGDGKYRLLMIYCDHSVLSYEIGRSKTRTGFEVNERVLLI